MRSFRTFGSVRRWQVTAIPAATSSPKNGATCILKLLAPRIRWRLAFPWRHLKARPDTAGFFTKRSHRRAFATYTSLRELSLHLQLPIDGAVIVPVLIPCGNTEHGYGHLRGSIGVGG